MNPNGYVLNAATAPAPDYLVLHRVDCLHLTGDLPWTTTDASKAPLSHDCSARAVHFRCPGYHQPPGGGAAANSTANDLDTRIQVLEIVLVAADDLGLVLMGGDDDRRVNHVTRVRVAAV